MSKTAEFKKWRAEERQERAEKRAAYDLAVQRGDEDVYMLMPPQSIRPGKMVFFGPEVCGWCLATADEDSKGCEARFHKRSHEALPSDNSHEVEAGPLPKETQ